MAKALPILTSHSEHQTHGGESPSKEVCLFRLVFSISRILVEMSLDILGSGFGRMEIHGARGYFH